MGVSGGRGGGGGGKGSSLTRFMGREREREGSETRKDVPLPVEAGREREDDCDMRDSCCTSGVSSLTLSSTGKIMFPFRASHPTPSSCASAAALPQKPDADMQQAVVKRNKT